MRFTTASSIVWINTQLLNDAALMENVLRDELAHGCGVTAVTCEPESR